MSFRPAFLRRPPRGGGLAATLAASIALSCALACPTAFAADATVSLSDITIQVSDADPTDGNSPWLWVVNNVDWASTSSAAQAQAGLAGTPTTQTGWSGVPLSALSSSGSTAQAFSSVGGGALGSGIGATGSASATASAGDGAWAMAQIFDGNFIVGAGTTLDITATVSNLSANADGGLAQAVASLGIANQDGSHFDGSQAWIFDSANFSDSNVPETLHVTWTNDTSDSLWGHIWISAGAQALASPVPEPATGTTLALGVGILGLLARRRQRAAR